MINLIRVLDGKVQFPICEIKFNQEERLIYSHEELEDLKQALHEHSITYEIIELERDMELEEKVKGMTYSSKTEAESHLLYNIPPESQKLPMLQQENEILRQKLEQQEQALLTIMFADME